MRTALAHTVAGLVTLTAVGGFAAPLAHAQTVDCSPLLANYVCAYPAGSSPQIAQLVSPSGDVRVLGTDGTNQVSGSAPLAAGDAVFTGEGQAVFDGGAQCNFNIGQQTTVTTAIENACVVVAITDLIAPAATTATLLSGDSHTILAVIGVGGGVAAYLLLQDEDEPGPVTPP